MLANQVIINQVDIWEEYGVFLTEERKGGRENLNAILSPSKVKEHVGVDIRENNGVDYSDSLTVKNQQRDLTLHFAVAAETKQQLLNNYFNFIHFLKTGNNGWLDIKFPPLANLTLTAFYKESTDFSALTYLWLEGKQATRFKVTFREPEPIL